MNAAVIDASVAVKWIVEEEHSDRAAALLGIPTLWAPAHWLAETINTLWYKVVQGRIDHATVQQRADTLLCAPVKTVALAALAKDALLISMTHGVSAYDAFYVALAVDQGLPFFTADQKLMRKLGQRFVAQNHIIWIGDYA